MNRGTALPETALIIGMVMLLVFGIAQLVMLGFTQSETEGAAFVAAHSIALNPSGNAATDKTYAMTILASPFPQVKSSDVTVSYPTSAPGTVQVVVSKDPGGLWYPGGGAMVSGATQTVNTTGIDMEVAPNPSPAATPVSGIAAQATLANYCAPTSTGTGANTYTCDATHPLYIAQYDILTGTGNGKNGQFEEWNCRYGLFPSYPSTMPSDGGQGGQWDPSSSTFSEKALYAFDTPTSQWGTKTSC